MLPLVDTCDGQLTLKHQNLPYLSSKFGL